MDEAADALTAQAERIEALTKPLEYAQAQDREDELTQSIVASMNTPGYWKVYGEALELVSNRYSKASLVRLTAYLLIKSRHARTN